jgi:hypothetical protein
LFNGRSNEIHSGKVTKVNKTKIEVSPISGGDSVVLGSRISVHSDKESALLKDYEKHAKSIISALQGGNPVSSEAIEAYGITLPDGYTLNEAGDLYVFNATPAPQAQPRAATTAPQETQQKAAAPATEPAAETEAAESPPVTYKTIDEAGNLSEETSKPPQAALAELQARLSFLQKLKDCISK